MTSACENPPSAWVQAHAGLLPAGGKVVALRVLQLGERRGSATDARTLYEVLED